MSDCPAALSARHPSTASALDALGWIRLQQGNYIEAEALLRQALDTQKNVSPPTWQRWNSESLLGTTLERQGKYAYAEALLISGYRGMVQQQSSIPFDDRPTLREARKNLIKLYLDMGEPDKARIESERAAQLRKDQERIIRLQSSILKNPGEGVRPSSQ